MSGYNRIIRSVLAISLSAAIAFSTMAFTAKDTYRELPEKRNVSADMVLSVPFDKQLEPSTINIGNISVRDSQGNLVAISRNVSKDHTTLIVSPMKGYAKGQAYTLYISGSVKYADGKAIGQDIRMKFTIANNDDSLAAVGSREKLAELMEKLNTAYGTYNIRGRVYINEAMSTSAKTADVAAATTSDSGTASPNYSKTNIQVEGVDEADVVKTDGQYIYQINNRRVIVAKAYPSEDMKVVGTINYNDDMFNPVELYVDEHYMVVIGSSNNNIPVYRSDVMQKKIAYPPFFANNTTRLYVYDITDKTNIKQVREIETEGSYLTSRKIGSKLYLVGNKHFNYYRILNDAADNDVPSYKDTAVGEDFTGIKYDRIYYFPDSVEPSYMIVAGIDLDNPKQGADVSAYLGSAENVYVSEQNMYAAVSKYDWSPKVYDSAVKQTDTVSPVSTEEKTVAYRFVLNEGKVEYTGKGEVPGTILNQFSMDESKGSFRIATTSGQLWGTEDNISKNNLYIMDDTMKIKGKLEGIAPGERIYSVRFMGDRAYMVTFRTVDPLFVIDLKNEAEPKILGALKIPGYSDYLHPYDENHIIGFGKDTVEIPYKDQNGVEIGRNAYYLGMKMAIFDVTDVQNPKELFSEKIGDRGTDSELLQNHKALMFSKEKGLLAFPVTLMETGDKSGTVDAQSSMPQYGTFAFQGAYIYNVDLKTGFKLKGRITHMTEEDYKKAGNYSYDSQKYVDRILYIGDNIYTMSGSMIMANDIKDLKQKNALTLP